MQEQLPSNSVTQHYEAGLGLQPRPKRLKSSTIYKT
jgi:hypothetical protein